MITAIALALIAMVPAILLILGFIWIVHKGQDGSKRQQEFTERVLDKVTAFAEVVLRRRRKD